MDDMYAKIGGVKGLGGPKEKGFLKMQIAGILGLSIVGQDPQISSEEVHQVIEGMVGRIEMKPQDHQSPLPHGRVTISRLADWFLENQCPAAQL